MFSFFKGLMIDSYSFNLRFNFIFVETKNEWLEILLETFLK